MSTPLYLAPVDLVVQNFDHHIDSCHLCLVQGNSLCYEGAYIVDSASEVRARSQRSRRPLPHFFPSSRRRPSFRGVAD